MLRITTGIMNRTKQIVPSITSSPNFRIFNSRILERHTKGKDMEHTDTTVMTSINTNPNIRESYKSTGVIFARALLRDPISLSGCRYFSTSVGTRIERLKGKSLHGAL